MIIVLKKGTAQKDIDSLTQMLTDEGVQVNPVIGTDITILGLVGDTTQVDPKPCGELRLRRPHYARRGALQEGEPHVPPRRIR